MENIINNKISKRYFIDDEEEEVELKFSKFPLDIYIGADNTLYLTMYDEIFGYVKSNGECYFE